LGVFYFRHSIHCDGQITRNIFINLIQPPLFNAQLKRTLGHTSYQGAEIGECIAIAQQLETGNRESWYEQWLRLANNNFAMAKTYSHKDQRLDAKLAFLRASNYYRTAYFFLEDEPNDPRIEHALERSVKAFHKAIDFFDSPVEQVAIPFETIHLPGYS